MDIREIAVKKLIGMNIAFLAPMNGGKTKALVGELERAIHSGWNVVAYNHATNKRDGDHLVIDGRHKFPAKSVSSIEEVKEDLLRRRELIYSKKISLQGDDKGKVEIEGIRHYKNTPLVAYGIDEFNLFALNEPDARKFLSFLEWGKENEFVGYFSGLADDFRHMDFGYVNRILRYFDIKQEKKPVCKAIHNGRQCGKAAVHTQRLWAVDFVTEVGLESLMEDMELFPFVDKDGDWIRDKYVPAPFFDKTVRIEESQDGRNVYLPVCDNCARLPYKEELFLVYDAIVKGENSSKALENTVLRKAIIGFLTDPNEEWVKEVERGKLVAVSHYHNRLGGYSPEK